MVDPYKIAEPSEEEKKALVQKNVHTPSEFGMSRSLPGMDVRGGTPRPVMNTISNFADVPPDPRHAQAIPLPLPKSSDTTTVSPSDNFTPGSPASIPVRENQIPDGIVNKGRGPAINPLPNRFVPIERDQTGSPIGGVVRPYNDTLGADISRQTGGKGFQAIPNDMGPNAGGGNVSQFVMSPEQQSEVAARRAEAIPAMESYEKALEQKNLNEGIHGADMARQIKMFQDKYGVDLRSKEFQLNREKLALEAPKIAAETAQAQAHADYFKNGGPAGNKSKDPRISQLNDMAKQIAHQLTTDPLMDDAKREELHAQWQNIYDTVGQLDASGGAKQPKEPAKPTPEQDTKIREIIKQKSEQNVHWGDIEKELTDRGLNPKEYESDYLKANKDKSKEPTKTSQSGNMQLAQVLPQDVPLGSGRAGQTGGLMELQKQYQDALAKDDFDKAEEIKKQMQELANKYQNVG